jgi:hypothetical protein
MARCPNGLEARLRAYTSDPNQLKFYNEGYEAGKRYTNELGPPSIPPGKQFYIIVHSHGEKVRAPPLPDGHPGGIFYMPAPGVYDNPRAFQSWRAGGLAPHQEIIFTGPEGDLAYAFDNQIGIECNAVNARYEQIEKDPRYEPRFTPHRAGTPSRYHETISNRGDSGGTDYEYRLAGDTTGYFHAKVVECYLNGFPPLIDLQDPKYQNIPFSYVYYFICAYVCGRMEGDLTGVSIYVHAIFCRKGECPVGPGLRPQRSSPAIEPPLPTREEKEAADRAMWDSLQRQQGLQRVPSDPAAVYGALPALPQIPGMPKPNPNSMEEDYGGKRTRRMRRRVKAKAKKQKQKKTRRRGKRPTRKLN